ncbi:MAG TPA: acVLRF1 family peptidyl-tRNA hydrolase [Pseudonocardiaceae bacterium]
MSRRSVEVEPERLAGWYERFGARHGGVTSTELAPDLVVVRAADGATASVTVPYGTLDAPAGTHDGLAVDALLAHLAVPRRVALLLVRLGGHTAGVAQDGVVERSSTDRRLVHGRHKAGGQSANRFRRRREGQARVALQAAADTAARVLLPELPAVDAVVLGGDRRALDLLREDTRLAPIFARAEPFVLDVPEPRRTVLDDAARRARCAVVTITEPS